MQSHPWILTDDDSPQPTQLIHKVAQALDHLRELFTSLSRAIALEKLAPQCQHGRYVPQLAASAIRKAQIRFTRAFVEK